MKTSSAKAKGRNLQKLVVGKILALFPQLEPDDVKSTSMGASGEDVQLSPAARRLIPISIECKAQEKVSVWASYDQAHSNAKNQEPVLVIRRNRSKPLAVVCLDYFLGLHSKGNTNE